MSLSSVFVVGNALRLKGFKSGFRTGRKPAGASEERDRMPLQQTSGESCGSILQEASAKGVGIPGTAGMQDGPAEKGITGNRAAADDMNKAVNGSENGKGRAEEPAERKKIMTKVMTIEGMMCGHCTGRVQKALEAVEGVSSVAMSLEEKTASVDMGAEVPDEVLTAAVADAGYEVRGISVK